MRGRNQVCLKGFIENARSRNTQGAYLEYQGGRGSLHLEFVLVVVCRFCGLRVGNQHIIQCVGFSFPLFVCSLWPAA